MSRCEACQTELVPGAKFCFQCGRPSATPAPENADPLIGKTLGNYRIISAIGQGGMGRVYRAEQVNLGRAVCIKTLLPQAGADGDLAQRFEREARAISALRHPNIVGLHDFGRTPDGILYLAMELVEGRNLRQLIADEAPLPLARFFSIADQVLSAIEEAHGAGVIHRDLKPENVLVARLRDGSDIVKVVDFGIAKVLNPDPADRRLTATGLVCGTPGYMAPEQITGGELDARADVYAAGVVFFEMLVGRPPFVSDDPQKLLQQHLTAIVPAPSTLAKLPIPPALDLAILQALANKRDRRFRSALDFKRSLEVVRSGTRPQTAVGAPASAPLATGVAPAGAAVPSAVAGAARTCPRCGHAETSDRKFCGECGAPMSGSGPSLASAPALSSPEMASLQRLMPQKLLDHIEDLSHLLAGERRHVAVLFGDISGFTAMSETMDPEDVRAVMNRAFDALVQVVNRYDGTVDKFIGDCIMVLFGAPRAHEDDPERAVRCGLDMQKALEQVSKTLVRPLRMRIGINCGEVVAGGVGGQQRMDYTVMGDVVNLAQRLESNAKVGTVCVSRAVRDLAGKAALFRALDPIKVKGKAKPVEIFEVDRLRPDQDAAGGAFVGRDRELDTLAGLLHSAREGKGGAGLVLGEAGMGKSRLLQALESKARAVGLTAVRVRTGRYGTPAPLELVRDALFVLAGGVPRTPVEADQALGKLQKLGVDELDVLRLQHLFGTAAGLAGFEHDEARRLNQAVVLRALRRGLEPNGLCLLLDDLHLADAASLEVLAELVRATGGRRLAIVGAARPGDTERLLPGAPRMDLEPLGPEPILEIARTQIGAALPPEAQSAIVGSAEGNPLFAIEVVRSLIDAGGLQFTGTDWRATPTMGTLALPDSLQLMLSARLDALSPAARLVLRYGAVAGRVFSVDLVAAVIDVPVDVSAAVQECVTRGFLAPSEQPPGAMQFPQAAVHDAVLRAVTKADLKHAHLRIAEALEKGHSFAGDHPADQLAHHFLAAEQYRKAVRYLAAAADRLMERSDFAGAAERYTKALGFVEKEAQRGTMAGAMPAELAGHLLTLAAKAAAALQMNAPDQAVAVVDRVLAAASPDRALAERAEALRQRGQALLKLSRPAEAEAAFHEALSCAAGRHTAEVEAGLRADLAAALEAKGDFARATQVLVEGLRALAGALEDRDLMWRYLNQLGRIHLRLRQPERAREFFENARRHAQRAKSALGESKAVANLASALSAGGDQAAALSITGEALELATRAGDGIGVARIHYNAGRLLLALGQKDAATQRLELARRMSQDMNWREGLAAAAQALDAAKASR